MWGSTRANTSPYKVLAHCLKIMDYGGRCSAVRVWDYCGSEEADPVGELWPADCCLVLSCGSGLLVVTKRIWFWIQAHVSWVSLASCVDTASRVRISRRSSNENRCSVMLKGAAIHMASLERPETTWYLCRNIFIGAEDWGWWGTVTEMKCGLYSGRMITDLARNEKWSRNETQTSRQHLSQCKQSNEVHVLSLKSKLGWCVWTQLVSQAEFISITFPYVHCFSCILVSWKTLVFGKIDEKQITAFQSSAVLIWHTVYKNTFLPTMYEKQMHQWFWFILYIQYSIEPVPLHPQSVRVIRRDDMDINTS